ncbi:hypothetical protein BKP43_20490 [Variovorax boronicumulans]|nr:hypothetical protein BKP43_20490 [Variovorax boronicumulans]
MRLVARSRSMRGEHAVHREARQDDLRAAHEHAAQQKRQPRQVKERRHLQQPRAVVEEGAEHRDLRVDHQRRVAEHHALGPAGGAAGVEHAGQVVSAAQRVGHGLALADQRFVFRHARGRLALAHVDPGGDGARGGAQFVRRRQELVVHEQDVRRAVVERVRHLGHAPARVDRVDHAAGPPHGQVVLQRAVGVEREHAHAIAGLHAQATQPTRQARDALAEFAVRARAALEHGGDGARAALHGAVQGLREVQRRWRGGHGQGSCRCGAEMPCMRERACPENKDVSVLRPRAQPRPSA